MTDTSEKLKVVVALYPKRTAPADPERGCFGGPIWVTLKQRVQHGVTKCSVTR